MWSLYRWALPPCASLPDLIFPRQHLEVLINQEITANEIKVTQLAFQLGLDRQEAVGHDLLHPLLWAKQGEILAVAG